MYPVGESSGHRNRRPAECPSFPPLACRSLAQITTSLSNVQVKNTVRSTHIRLLTGGQDARYKKRGIDLTRRHTQVTADGPALSEREQGFDVFRNGSGYPRDNLLPVTQALSRKGRQVHWDWMSWGVRAARSEATVFLKLLFWFFKAEVIIFSWLAIRKQCCSC